MANEMRDRLVELLDVIIQPGQKTLGDIADHLIESGVIVPPCKVGDVIYKIQYCRCGNPEAFEMKHCHKKETSKTPKVFASVMFQQKGRRLTPGSFRFEPQKYEYKPPKYEYKPIGTICYKVVQKPFKLEWINDFGKTVFLTKEEAEQKLKELRKNNDL